MKILIIHRSFALVGGAERVIIDKANYLSDQGHEIMLVSYEQGQHPVSYELNSLVKLTDLDCRFFALSKYHFYARIFHFLRLKKTFKCSLRDTITEFSPQVIVLASDWLFLIKIVLDVAHSIPVISEFHNSYDYIIRKIGNEDNVIKTIIVRFYYRSFLKHFKKCKCLISLTENDARHWRNHSNHVVVIPNPLTLYPERIDDVPKEDGRIICVGRLNSQKRIDRLITAFSMIADKYPKWHVDVFGDGDLRTSLQQQIDSYNLRERFVLNEPTKEIYKEYKKSQMLVLSSEYEGWGLILVEAMSCGIPCVSFDCPSGPSEIIDDGITGLIARNGDVQDLTKKMEWMITHDDERKRMGENARSVAAKYRQSAIMKEWEEIYTKYDMLI